MRLRFFIRLAPVLLWYCVIFWFSSRPDLPSQAIDWLDFMIKKSAHVGEFAILSGLLYFAFWPKKSLVLPLGLLAAFSDEIHQLYTAGRGAKLSDVLIDSTGLLVGFFIIRKFYGHSSRLRPARH